MPHRRQIIAALAALPLASLPRAAMARDYLDIEWADLIPEGDNGTLLNRLRGLGVVEHGELSTGFVQEEARAVTTEFNGKHVRIPGFIVPLEFDAAGVTTFILAPFVGACIHVPPPPANQLILVSTDTPYEYDGLFDPVHVSGPFRTAGNATVLADIGYAMTAERITPYEFPSDG